ncbi:hypothetical protein PRZ48_004538 [Zasmidium cellare]|uniref:Uncharacterized protein n=1 Tax=Zasmidium cellare TaxID=395010 RepID=A0ABR0ERA0_ZASCE|nr:hypothetical protein PRZ48_004538 [Zasmidium cellare]
MANAKGKKPCRLLELPLKLRVRIWEAATQEKDDIDINRIAAELTQRSPHCPPQWLDASRQVLREAFPIWFRTNNFICEIGDDEDIKDLIAFEALGQHFVDTAKMNVRVAIKSDFTTLSAGVFKIWVQHIHSGGNWRATMEASEGAGTVLLATSLEQAFLCRKMSWEDFEKVVDVSTLGFSLFASKVRGIDAL